MTQNLNEITQKLIAAGISVHRELGPGLLESPYEACMVYELAGENSKIERQKSLPVTYRGIQLDRGYRIDLMVEDKVVIEIKQLTGWSQFVRLNYYLTLNYPDVRWDY